MRLEETKFIQQITNNQGIGANLLTKAEFNFLKQYFFANESLNSLIVGQIMGKLYLLGFSDQRFFLVEKDELQLYRFQRYGLEEIKDLKLQQEVGSTNLVIILTNHQQIKVTGLSEAKAQQFGKNLVTAIRHWNDRFKEI